MKKIGFIILVVALFASCQYPNSTQQVLTDNTLRIEQFVDTFLVQHPDWNNNTVTREKANKEFKKLFHSTMEQENLLAGVPMELKSVHKVKGKNMVHFWLNSTPRDFEYKQIEKYELGIYSLYGDVIGNVPDSIVAILVENNYYDVSGHYVGDIGDITTMQFLIGSNEWAVTNKIGIENESLGQNVSVGIILMDIDSLKPFSGRKSYPIQQNNTTETNI